MIDLDKIDNKDFVFLAKPLDMEEEKKFSEFLKARKNKVRQKRGRRLSNTQLAK